MSNGVTLSIIVWASLYVSINQFARGLPTRRMCSTLGLNVPVSKRTSLIGSSLSARIMCPKRVIFLCFHLVESLIWEYPYLRDSSCKTAWLVHALLTYVEGTPRILRSIFIWKLSISFCSLNVSCIDSKPYRSLLAKVLSKTRIFQVFEVRAWNQRGFSCLAVATTAPILCESSWRLSTVSVKVAPKYFAWSFRGTDVPLRNFTEDWCWLIVIFTHLSKFSSVLYLADSTCIACKELLMDWARAKNKCTVSIEDFCIVDARYGR